MPHHAVPHPVVRRLVVLLTSLGLAATGLVSIAGAASARTTPLVVTGASHTCAVTEGGSLWCFGRDTSAQVGNGSASTAVYGAVPASILSEGVVAVAAGDSHTCALTSAGAVKCWGQNSNGQLGNGTTGGVSATPVTAIASGVTGIAAGAQHTCAVNSSGAVLCWGANSNGQLGDGTTVDKPTPTEVSVASEGVAAVSAGTNNTCALANGGAVLCWGANSYGQLGNNSITPSTTPVPVWGLVSGVAGVSVGKEHACASLSSGTVRCWGRNNHGQLGDSTTTDHRTPVTVLGLTSISLVAAGGAHSCAKNTTSSVYCWGDDSSGQLGNGNPLADSLIPVTAMSSGALTISAGGSHTCAVTTASSVRCWGNNGDGQLGLGSSASAYSTTPADVVGLEMFLRPTVVINSPATGTVTTKKAIVVAFTKDGNNGLPMWCTQVNGGPRALQLGRNTVTVTCVATSGHSASATVVVTRKLAPFVSAKLTKKKTKLAVSYYCAKKRCTYKASVTIKKRTYKIPKLKKLKVKKSRSPYKIDHVTVKLPSSVTAHTKPAKLAKIKVKISLKR